MLFIKKYQIKCGSFVILPYEFSDSLNTGVITKRLVAVVNRIDTKSNKYVCYGKTLITRRIQLDEGDTDTVERSKVIELLPCPILCRGVYEFDEDLDIDSLIFIIIFRFCFLKCVAIKQHPNLTSLDF